MAQLVQTLCQATCVPAQMDSSSGVVEQSVMVILFSNYNFFFKYEKKFTFEWGYPQNRFDVMLETRKTINTNR